jgi:LacI family transcriptional regulator
MVKEAKRVTIYDVAQYTGLAVSTVSNALHGRRHVREETREIVRDAAAKLGYHASPLAQALRTGRSAAIGVLVPDISNPAYPDIVRGVEDIASHAGRTLVLCNTDGDETKQLLSMQWLLDRGIDGMILISQNCTSPRVRELLKRSQGFVLVQRCDPRFDDDYVGSNNASIVRDTLVHLHDLGHRRIGYARGPHHSSTSQERTEVFHDEVRRLGLDASAELIYEGDHTVGEGYNAGKYFLSLSSPPTAVIANCDVNAIGVMQAAIERGLRIPDDLSVTGIDDIDIAGSPLINLTTVRQDRRAIGTSAAELLLKRLLHSSRRSRRVIVPTRLVVRGSTAAPPRLRKRKFSAERRDGVRIAPQQ